jgi:hypothetical protein
MNPAAAFTRKPGMYNESLVLSHSLPGSSFGLPANEVLVSRVKTKERVKSSFTAFSFWGDYFLFSERKSGRSILNQTMRMMASCTLLRGKEFFHSEFSMIGFKLLSMKLIILPSLLFSVYLS